MICTKDKASNIILAEHHFDKPVKEAARNPSKTIDFKGEAQNVNEDKGRPLHNEEAASARNRANESSGKWTRIKQQVCNFH